MTDFSYSLGVIVGAMRPDDAMTWTESGAARLANWPEGESQIEERLLASGTERR